MAIDDGFRRRTAVDEEAFEGRWLRKRGGEKRGEEKEKEEEKEGHGWK